MNECSPTCEHVSFHGTPCGEPTEFAYKAQRGWMALCREHAKKHLKYAIAVKLVNGVAVVEVEPEAIQ